MKALKFVGPCVVLALALGCAQSTAPKAGAPNEDMQKKMMEFTKSVQQKAKEGTKKAEEEAKEKGGELEKKDKDK